MSRSFSAIGISQLWTKTVSCLTFKLFLEWLLFCVYTCLTWSFKFMYLPCLTYLLRSSTYQSHCGWRNNFLQARANWSPHSRTHEEFGLRIPEDIHSHHCRSNYHCACLLHWQPAQSYNHGSRIVWDQSIDPRQRANCCKYCILLPKSKRQSFLFIFVIKTDCNLLYLIVLILFMF